MHLSPADPGWTRLQLGRGRRRLHPWVWLQLFLGGRQAGMWLWATALLVPVTLFGAFEPLQAWLSRPDDLVAMTVRHVDTVSARMEINDTQVFATTVAWTLDGEAREGRVYVTGEPTWGETIEARVSRRNPTFVEVPGTRTTRTPLGMSLLLLLMPGVAMLAAVWAWPARLRAARLLRSGAVTTATLVRSDDVGDSDHPKVRCQFRFEVGGVSVDHELTLDATGAARVRDDAREVVFYDPAEPSRAVLADSLPGEIFVGEGDQLVGPPRALALLLPPLLCGGAAMWAAGVLDGVLPWGR